MHDLHNDYPLAIYIGQIHKLIPILNNKKRYVLQYRNLKLYMDLGLKVTNIRVLEFDWSPWLNPLLIITLIKKEAKNDFQRLFQTYE